MIAGENRTPGARTGRTRWRTIAIAIAAGCCAGAWSLFGPAGELPPGGASPDTPAGPPAPLVPGPAPGPGAHPVAALAERDAGTLTEAPRLMVILRGLDPGAHWTAPLRLRWQSRDEPQQPWRQHEDHRCPDAAGAAAFDLPAWAVRSVDQELELSADDPAYAPLTFRHDGPLDLGSGLVLHVQVIAIVRGRVITARGEPVAAARIRAFLRLEGELPDDPCAQASTAADGTFGIRVPPAVPLRLLAMPPARAAAGSSPSSPAQEPHLLPAMQHILGAVGHATTVADFVLPDAAVVAGVVRREDDSTVPGAAVVVVPLDGEPVLPGLCSVAGGALAPANATTTDAAGRFALPAVPGCAVTAAVHGIPGCHLVGEWIAVTAIAPQTIELRLPPVVVLCTMQDGAPFASAMVEIELPDPQGGDRKLRWPPLRADAAGRLHVLTALPRFVARATGDGRYSGWIDVEPARQREVELLLAHASAVLTIGFEGPLRPAAAHVRWTRGDGQSGQRTLAAAAPGGPLRLDLEPGTYRLRIGPTNEGPGRFALPVERDVTLTATPQHLVLALETGGRFSVRAVDAKGLHVGGTCRVFDAAGNDRTAQFVVHGEDGLQVGRPGQLLTSGANEHAANLPAGDYVLEFELDGHAPCCQPCTVRPGETTAVTLRLR